MRVRFLLFSLFSAVACVEGQGQTRAQELLIETWPARGQTEVLLAAGQSGLGQVFWVSRDPDDRLRVGCDWVEPEPAWASSAPFVAPSLPARVTVVTALLGEEADSFREVALQVEGEFRLLAQRSPLGSPSKVQFGRNHVGGMSALVASTCLLRPGKRIPVEEVLGERSPALSTGSQATDALRSRGAVTLEITPSASNMGEEVLFDFGSLSQSHTLTIERSVETDVNFNWRQAAALLQQGKRVVWPAAKSSEIWINFPRKPGAASGRADEIASDFLNRYLVVLGENTPLLFAPTADVAPTEGMLVLGRAAARTGQPSFTGQWRNLRQVRPIDFLERLQQQWRKAGGLPPDGDDWPGGFRLRAEPKEDLSGHGSPLVVAGVAGQADFVHLVWTAPGRAKIGVDHWGVGTVYGDEFNVPAGPWEIEIRCDAWRPGWEGKSSRLVATVSGQTVFDRLVEMYPVDPTSLRVGVNIPGGSTTVDAFNGVLLDVKATGDRRAAR